MRATGGDIYTITLNTNLNRTETLGECRTSACYAARERPVEPPPEARLSGFLATFIGSASRHPTKRSVANLTDLQFVWAWDGYGDDGSGAWWCVGDYLCVAGC